MPVRVYLKAGRERPVLRGHPWVFSGAIETIEDDQGPGELCDIFSHDMTFLARGYINRHSQITCRIISQTNDPIDAHFFRQRIQAALDHRRSLLPPDTNAYRLINSEGDFLPGLTVDIYGSGVCCQFFTAGMERWKSEVVSILSDLLGPVFIYERSEGAARGEEGLDPIKGLLQGNLPSVLKVTEHGHLFQVDVATGQKTGLFLDQRENRRLFGSLAEGRRVCDCFCYGGGFSIYAAAAGAKSITAVDTSREALKQARNNLALNKLNVLDTDLICQDVFQYLRHTSDQFDLMVLDPPPFAPKKSAVPRASRGYKDINMQALRLLTPGGVLFTFSCSQAINSKLFQQIIFAAAVDAGRRVQMIHRTGHPFDHPVSLLHPEGEYLQGLVLRVVE